MYVARTARGAGSARIAALKVARPRRLVSLRRRRRLRSNYVKKSAMISGSPTSSAWGSPVASQDLGHALQSPRRGRKQLFRCGVAKLKLRRHSAAACSATASRQLHIRGCHWSVTRDEAFARRFPRPRLQWTAPEEFPAHSTGFACECTFDAPSVGDR